MNKISLLSLCCLLLCSLDLGAQYYYNDLLVNRQNLDKHQLYKQQKVTRISIKSTDPNAPETEGLTVEQVYNSSYSQLKTRTSTVISKSAITNYYNPQGQLYKTVDSSENAVTTYEYQYVNDRLTVITSTSNAPGEKMKTVETHTWYYDNNGNPESMLRVRDMKDSMELKLKRDDKGLVTEEQVFRKAIAGEKVFYYYDDAGRISDVVRYQEKLGKLIPDYTFDYDAAGRLSTMMVVQNGGTDYLTWKYEYDEKGLIRRESCLNRQKKLVGKVEYSYEIKK